MEIGSVSSGNNAALLANLQAQQGPRSAERDAQAQALQKAPGSEPAQGTTPANERQAQAVTEAEKSRPTVNMSGQTVGTRINTTA